MLVLGGVPTFGIIWLVLDGKCIGKYTSPIESLGFEDEVKVGVLDDEVGGRWGWVKDLSLVAITRVGCIIVGRCLTSQLRQQIRCRELGQVVGNFLFRIHVNGTVDGRNPKQPPGMYKTL